MKIQESFKRRTEKQFSDFFEFLSSSAGKSQEVRPGVFRPSDGSVSCRTLVVVFLYRGRVV